MLVTWATVVSMLLIQVQYGAIEDFKERRWAMICLSNDDTDCYRVSKLNMNTKVPRIYPIAVKGETIQVTNLHTHFSFPLCLGLYHVSVCWVLAQ